MKALWLTLLVAALLGACALDDGPFADSSAPAVEVNVAALGLVGAADVVWDLRVANAAGATVWERRITSSRFGDGAGSASVVGPCDASGGTGESPATNTAHLWVVGVYAGAVADPGAFDAGASPPVGDTLDFQNPTSASPLSREFGCAPNADTGVAFDVTLLRPASQGFVDLAVSFRDVFCSAKLDCGAPPLLHNADGERDRTIVLGFSCAGSGGGDETTLYLSDLVLTCPDGVGSEAVALALAGRAPGNQGAVALGSERGLFQWALYTGEEHLAGVAKRYINLALGADDLAGCSLALTATADAGDLLVPHGGAAGAIPAGVVYPYVAWDLADLGACAGNHALTYGQAGAVETRYTGTGDLSPLPFAAAFGPLEPVDHGCEDPHWDDVVLLLPFDDGLEDVSPNPKAVTPTSANAPTISTTIVQHGAGAVDMGTDTRTFAVAGSPDLAFGTGDFTIEAWVYPRSFPASDGWANIIGSVGYAGSSQWRFYVRSNFFVYFWHWTTTNVGSWISPPTLSTHAWQHIAVTRQGGTLRLFHNGVGSIGGTSSSTQALNGGSAGLNSSASFAFDGLIDDLRITRGVARYSSDFTPPGPHPVCGPGE